MGEDKLRPIRPTADKDPSASHILDRDPANIARRQQLAEFRKLYPGVMQGWQVDVNGNSSRGTIQRFHANGFVVVRYDNMEQDFLVEPLDIRRVVNPSESR